MVKPPTLPIIELVKIKIKIIVRFIFVNVIDRSRSGVIFCGINSAVTACQDSPGVIVTNQLCKGAAPIFKRRAMVKGKDLEYLKFFIDLSLIKIKTDAIL